MLQFQQNFCFQILVTYCDISALIASNSPETLLMEYQDVYYLLGSMNYCEALMDWRDQECRRVSYVSVQLVKSSTQFLLK